LGEEVVLEMIRRHGSLSMRELQEKTGLSVNQVRSRLRDLLERGEISATAPATSKNRRYVPNTSDHA
jgi:ATP-dependent DNA helicase RecG